MNNETLFWKVFNNKYLVRLIFEKIESINVQRKPIKFKEITKLEWFVKHDGQHELLKCKLKANESIEIEESSLLGLISKLLIEPLSIPKSSGKVLMGEYKLGDEYSCSNEVNEYYKKINKQRLIEKSNSIQLFNLLLNYKSMELVQFNIVNLIASNTFIGYNTDSPIDQLLRNELVETIITTEPYCSSNILVNSNTIKLVIQTLSPFTLDKLLQHSKLNNVYDTIMTDEIKNHSISLVGKNSFRDEMLEFILNNQNYQLYNSGVGDDKVIGLDILFFLSIESTEIQNQLLKLNLVSIRERYGYSPLSNELKQMELELFKNYTNNKDNQDVKIQNIYKFYSKHVGEIDKINIYDGYLNKYDEPIDEIQIKSVYLYTLCTKSLNALKYLISKEPKKGVIHSSISMKEYLTEPSDYKINQFQISNESTWEFIKLYINHGCKYFENTTFTKEILQFIFSIDSDKEFQKLICSIERIKENEWLTNSIPKVWISVKVAESKRILIKDTESIDLIYKEWESVQSYYFFHHKRQSKLSFKFETYQLIDYAVSKYGSNSLFFKTTSENYGKKKFIVKNSLFGDDEEEQQQKQQEEEKQFQDIDSSFYLYPFTRSINNCDIQSLAHIDQLLSNRGNIKFDKFEGCKSIDNKDHPEQVLEKIKDVKKIQKISSKIKINFNYQTTSTTKLIDYLNTSGFKLFSNGLFKKFVIDISKLEFIDIPNIKINFQQFQNQSMELVMESISNNISSKLILLVLNNFNPFKLLEQSFIDRVIEKWETDQSELCDSSYYKFHSNWRTYENFKQSCLFYFIGTTSSGIQGPYISRSYESSTEIISTIGLLFTILNNINGVTIGKLINYLFKRLIKIDKVSVDQVLNTYQNIKSKWLTNTGMEFKFQHSLYHIFYYILIRSLKFTNYILKLELITKVIIENGKVAFDNTNYKFEDQDYYYNSNNQNPNDYLQLLKPDLFTIDFIFNTPYQQLFDTLKSFTTTK